MVSYTGHEMRKKPLIPLVGIIDACLFSHLPLFSLSLTHTIVIPIFSSNCLVTASRSTKVLMGGIVRIIPKE